MQLVRRIKDSQTAMKFNGGKNMATINKTDTMDCIACCDYCLHYKDHGGGAKKRSGFAGMGMCGKLSEEVMASDSCDEFECLMCAL